VVRSPVRADIFSGLLSTQQWWVAGLFRLSEVKAARKAMGTYLTLPCAWKIGTLLVHPDYPMLDIGYG